MRGDKELSLMRTAGKVAGVIYVAFVALGVRATAQLTLPDGPNRDLVSRTCGTCHDMGMVVGTGGRSREGWNGTIEDMISYGMSISAEERRLVLDYLSTYFSAPR
jgi:hypothetical protein